MSLASIRSGERFLADAEATAAFGRELAVALREQRGAVIHLRGTLGAGKTTLARELLRALGVTGTIRSPTYTLMEPYELPDRRVLHMDLYRIEASDLDQLGLDDYPPEETLWLVEWPEKGGAGVPRADLDLLLEPAGEGRKLQISTRSPPASGNSPDFT
ncbi:MAG: tsaE [Hydrocarboniphaga sp.]|uniref:tRNA (adenosine(37)-N6)-threonylcarbamoyltransferase complex ATPase subunit type 1 TsaE n=1 Tax=Hydrocarboniphaga sp. TaxID=2033016 RepID=UPI002609ED64|nr:tRNA (adenosine(37)-N6)-threonylcarbamoyltransferase complex ATPase subunit type 1 TsaE [Hydrocarboniphaga sp.]MDB5968912.1 tsaE [Hydrocarboniphaga sp.]